MDELGQLVADSSGMSPLRNPGPEAMRLTMHSHTSAPVRRAAAQILADLSNLDGDGADHRLTIEGEDHLLHAFRYARRGGLQLVAGIVVPLNAYAEPLAAGVNRRAGVAFVLTMFGLVAAVMIARAITRPIRDLDRVSRRVASGDWKCEVPRSRIVEIGGLAESFGVMAQRLQAMTENLERRVEQRTLELADTNARLDLLSRTDQLTGLANRRHFDEELAKEWSRARRQQLPLSLLVCDVDWFKAYNDRYGHVAGDACLRSIADVLTSTARRNTDLAARYGGEEFVVIFPGLPRGRAITIARTLRHDVEHLEIEHDESPVGCVTISIGVATMTPRPGDGSASDPIEILEAADRALYDAKRKGRNRIEFGD
jgi:diguanylate cyclase (GGDEF)-like protein